MSCHPHEALKAHLLQKIEMAGRITFADFMQTVLYHPEHGYYHRSVPKIGKEGDYYTSADVHPIFGRLIAKQIAEMWERLDRPQPFQLVEMGAGKGLLAFDVLNALGTDAPALRDHLEYHLIETSAYQREQQKARLQAWSASGVVRWSDWLSLEREGVTGVILSNEWIDALPVHRVRQHPEGLREIYVIARDGELAEAEAELSTPQLSDYFSDWHIALEEAQIAEVNLAALDWVARIGRALQKGFVMTIDYGYLADELYLPQRPHGTLLCYYRHTTSADPFARLGEQDITAHVNFSSLMREGERHGLRTTGFTTQKNFLLGLGLAGYLTVPESDAPDPVQQIRTRLAIKNLILPTGMGEVFKVLIQHKGLAQPDLSGLSAADAWRIE